ncbi:C2H2-type domain-containing protein [Aphis craccivora]|uniref:C2H2-type domain-containing protein n=1 Tax=Aphis craccivora TaxID=307492 RepID=A0A6G0YGD1_APHCR|nr:C2H2-type domain-containing protein [Aphis craccivora]
MFECANCNFKFRKKCYLIRHIMKLHVEGRTIKSSKPLTDTDIELNIINMNFVNFQGKYTT